MRLGELFAGYGGLGMAVEEVFGAELAWVSEWEAAPSKILAHHWPNVPNYGDITKINWAEIEHVDIISGGFPCQDLSLAGKQRGMGKGTRSGLWANMLEGIEIIQPRYVVAENVRGLLSGTAHSDMEPCPWCLGADGDKPNLRALGAVLGDLADIGFDAEWRGIRASDIGATHNRFRVFLLAKNTNSAAWRERRITKITTPGQAQSGRTRPDASGRTGTPVATDASRFGLEAGRLPRRPARVGLNRADQLKALGNGVVPQQAIAALRDMLAAFTQKEAAA